MPPVLNQRCAISIFLAANTQGAELNSRFRVEAATGSGAFREVFNRATAGKSD